MLFNSFVFLVFFAIFSFAYYATPHRLRWPLLAGASVFFYGTFQVSYVALLLGVTVVAYVAALVIEGTASVKRRRATLIVSVAAVLATLVVFKYFDFLAASIDGVVSVVRTPGVAALPRLNLVVAAGLSFYTFSAVSYLVDVYRGRMAAERHLGYFTVYVSFFPKLLAGPIERAKPFLGQVRQPVRFDSAGVTMGLQLMLWGLFKKVVIADRLAAFVDTAYGQASFASPADLLIATYFFAFQLYCDFSGYSDMAIGAARVLGFDLSDNFRRPYLSTSVPEFWARRWHLSLAGWFRDYMYVPMGGSRVSQSRRIVNVLSVFLLSGLWHGANWTFVVWGGLNGMYAVCSSMTAGLRHALMSRLALPRELRTLTGALVTFHLILLTWVFFRAASIDDALTILSRVMAAAPVLPRLVHARFASADMQVSLALIVTLMGVEVLDEARPMWERLRARPVYVRWAAYYLLLLSLLVLGTWNLNQFVYMQF